MTPRGSIRRICALAAGLGLLVGALVGGSAWREHRIVGMLLRPDPNTILNDPALLATAVGRGRPLYVKHCAVCHGVALNGGDTVAGISGTHIRGVPYLRANVWLYGNDPVSVEHTILYGIRSGHPKARNVADMPAEVRTGQISAADAKDVVEYVESLNGASRDAAQAQRGHDVYFGAGNCFDCHAADATGITDYGTPALIGPRWLYGSDRDTLYQSVRDGRHGICPAWIDRLTPVEIRSLTLYLVTAAHP